MITAGMWGLLSLAAARFGDRQGAIRLIDDEVPFHSITVKLPFTTKAIRVVPGVATAAWWDNVAAMKWEPGTWRAFNQEITSGMRYIGFGEWVGVTGLFAAQRASEAILMDADPFVYKELKRNVDANAAQFRVVLDTRCISDKKGYINMRANGGSGSSTVDIDHARGSDFKNVTVSCTTLPLLLAEYGWIDNMGDVFIKIDTEGAESVIVPTLREMLKGSKQLPTIFLSMHDMSNAAQRGAIADVLNLYPYYAVIPGRNSNVALETFVDDCSYGVKVRANTNGKRFVADNVCSWCDYLLVASNANSLAKCGSHANGLRLQNEAFDAINDGNVTKYDYDKFPV